MLGIEFLAQDVMTGQVLGNVNIRNFQFKQTLNGFGDWSGTMAIGPDDDPNMFDLTDINRRRILVVRGGEVIAGLDVWKRERSLGKYEVSIGGSLTGGQLLKQTIGGRNNKDLSFQQVEQQRIAHTLVELAIAEWGWFGIEPPDHAYNGPARPRDKNTWEASDGKSYGEALTDLVNLQNGFQFLFEPFSPAPGVYKFRLVTGAPFIPRRDPIVAEWSDRGDGQFSGNIRDLQMSESIAAMATDITVWGSGEGRDRLRAKASNELLASVSPRLARTESRTDVDTQSWLNDRAATLRGLSESAAYAPTLVLASDDPDYPFGSYTVGDQVIVAVDPCPAFPNGLSGMWRIYEIEYSPGKWGNDIALTIGGPE